MTFTDMINDLWAKKEQTIRDKNVIINKYENIVLELCNLLTPECVHKVKRIHYCDDCPLIEFHDKHDIKLDLLCGKTKYFSK
jgi:hypothetical protein